MKKLILSALLIISAITIQAQEIKWVTLNEAFELQKTNPKKIIMDVYTNWCGPCKLLDKNTFHNKDVVEYINKNYYAVKFNGEGDEEITFKGDSFGNPKYDAKKASRRNSSHEFANFMRINAYPTLVFFDEKGDFITPVKGYQSPKQIELYLKMFVNNEHTKLTSQEAFNEYYKAFKPTFNE